MLALLEAGADVNARDKGVTALMLAAAAGHADTVQVLLDAGVDINAKTKEGATALEAAVRAGYLQVVNLLQKAGAKE